MNALITILLFFLGLGHPAQNQVQQGFGTHVNLPNGSNAEVLGLHTTRSNPRTVVALEDTHFRPAN